MSNKLPQRKPTFSSFEELLAFTNFGIDTIVPKPIKHVVLDADDTIWTVEPWGLISLCEPIGKTEGHMIKADCGETYQVGKKKVYTPVEGKITLKPKLRETLKHLNEKQVKVSIASTNDRKAVEKALEAFGLTHNFSHVKADWETPKSKMVEQIAKTEKIDPKDILFVDDGYHNAADVAATGASSIVMGHTIQEIDEILRFIK